ncbi:hypothetical protein D6783_01900 [Candidatus Woesearchaeota archaeon]|nr:MAG: hypothetical protein D6783_01900 [Candidatus Woesearchaeota archaeon]
MLDNIRVTTPRPSPAHAVLTITFIKRKTSPQGKHDARHDAKKKTHRRNTLKKHTLKRKDDHAIMKKPKTTRRFCPACKKHTEQKIFQGKKRGRSATHPLSYGGTKRVKLRGERRGAGNLGKYSKTPKPKRQGKKLAKRTDFRYTCTACSKTFTQPSGIRAKKVEII